MKRLSALITVLTLIAAPSVSAYGYTPFPDEEVHYIVTRSQQRHGLSYDFDYQYRTNQLAQHPYDYHYRTVRTSHGNRRNSRTLGRRGNYAFERSKFKAERAQLHPYYRNYQNFDSRGYPRVCSRRDAGRQFYHAYWYNENYNCYLR